MLQQIYGEQFIAYLHAHIVLNVPPLPTPIAFV